MSIPKELLARQLRATLDPARVPWSHSDDIPENGRVKPPQPRALQAMELGLSIKDPGYNIYVAGEPDLGRSFFVRDFLEPRAARRAVPPDMVYVSDFDDPDKSVLLRLPAGSGREFRSDVAKAVAGLRKAIPARLEKEAYLRKKEDLAKSYREAREKLLEQVEKVAAKSGFEVNLDDQGSLTLYPLVDGKVLTDDDFERLDPELRKTLRDKGARILQSVAKVLRRVKGEEADYNRRSQELETETAKLALDEHLGPLEKRWSKPRDVARHLKKLRADALDGLEHFLPKDTEKAAPAKDDRDAGAEDFFTRYQVNLFVDNAETTGAPVIFEDHPTPGNLLGCIERETELGALYTDFTLIKSGALHRADKGFLILRMEDILSQPDAWEGLLRALRSGVSRLDDAPGEGDGARTRTIVPDPVPLDVKVILIGSDETYENLLVLDDRFSKLFKVKAHLQDTVARTPKAIKSHLLCLGRIIREAGLPPFDREALAALVDHASRRAEDQEKLSLQWPLMRELMVEAAAQAKRKRKKVVDRDCLLMARRGKYFRANLYEEEFMGDYDRELIRVSTKGSETGRANGLSVTWYGDFEFGLPHQIACTVGVGHGGILDLERESELGGPIHTKGMMIIKSYLLGLFAQDKPLAMTGSLCFEQSYAGVEGDSASGAELAALLSALSGAPIDLSKAFTGAVNQSGRILSVGGVNRKIEGFFEVCRRRGLTGEQGVLIPRDNAVHLMLREEIVRAVSEGMFHVWPMDHIDQAMELLTGLPAGRLVDGGFAPDSLYDRVDRRLARLARLAE